MRLRNKEQANAANARYYQKNKEKIRKIQSERGKMKRATQPEYLSRQRTAWLEINREKVKMKIYLETYSESL